MAKNCVQGTPCGSTCIYQRYKCDAEFPKEVGRGVSTLRNLLKSRVEAGAISEADAEKILDKMTRGNQKEYDPVGLNEESWKEWEVGWTEERTKELDAAFAGLRKQFPDDAEFESKLNNVVDFTVGALAYEREKITPPTPDEIEGLVANRESLEKLSTLTEKVRDNPNMTLEQVGEELRPFAEARRTQDVTDAEVDMFVALMPTQERNYFRNAGALGTKETGGVYGDNPESDAVPVRNGPLDMQSKPEADNRLKLFARIFMEEDGRDGYSGQKIHITECDMEHIIPESIGGKRSEQGLNYTFLKSGFNQPRSNKPQKEWLDKELAKYEFESGGRKLTKESREKVARERIEKMQKVAEKNQFLRLATQAKRADEVQKLLEVARSQPDAKLRSTFESKLVALSLNVRGTMTLGLTSNQRGMNIWNWYNSGMGKGGERAGRLLAEKRAEIAGDPAKEKKMAQMMRQAPKRMEAYVRAAVPVDEGAKNPRTGQPDYVVKGDKRKEMTAAIEKIREEVINDILAI
jgi:hypothetical protein